MARNTRFTWNASNTQTFEKTIRNFNAKVRYQKKVHPELTDILPDVIKGKQRKDLKEMLNDDYTTQNDFERQMRSLQRFSRRDATKVVQDVDENAILNWQKKEIQYKVNTVNQKLKKQRKELEKSPELNKAGNIQYEEIQDIKLDKVENRNWKSFAKYLDAQMMNRGMQKKQDTYKERFLKKLESMQADTDKAYDFFSRIPANKLWEARYQKDKTLWASFFYDPNDDSQWLVDNAESRWRDYLGLEENETYEDLQNEEILDQIEEIITKRKKPKGS